MARRLLRRYADYALDTLEACLGGDGECLDGGEAGRGPWYARVPDQPHARPKRKPANRGGVDADVSGGDGSMDSPPIPADDLTASPARQLLNALASASLYDLQTNASLQFFMLVFLLVAVHYQKPSIYS